MLELLAPAGNLEKLKMAVIYGAHAVYIGGEEYGLRAFADNFNIADMAEGVNFAHSHGRKVYLTMNIIPHNEDLIGMEEYIKKVSEIGIDAIILSDPGVLSVVKDTAPDMEIHLSTQANNTNWRSAAYWHAQGVKRVILARELSLNEIKEIRDKTPKTLDLEVFVHGAMCISYSGRCLLSNYMVGRDANRGQCAHPCRWSYHLVEEKRPGEYIPVYEDERGTYIFNSKDLCMLQYIPEIVSTGATSLKIEGRMKSSYYVATVVKAYKEALESYQKDPSNYTFDPDLMAELSKASHREYTTGFYFGKPGAEEQIYHTSSYVRDYDFVGMVKRYDNSTGIAEVEQRNRMFTGEEIEVVPPKGRYFTQKIAYMKDSENNIIESAPHPQMTVYMPIDREVPEYSMLRRKGE